ncbi:MAG: type II secretion system protein GspK, partial [Gammaproteobacteria bacterium]|nr:type II secretion system protein GspK [Gammaproteobacteria bacterium]
LHLHPPTISSKQEMTNISELRLVLGITPTIYSALQPYVTALPVAPPDLSPSPPVNPSASPASDSSTPVATVTPIDINAAWAPVLLAADPTLTLEQAQSLVACRNRFGGVVSDMKTFMANCAAPMGVATLQNVAVTSQYFLVQTQAVYGDHQVFLKSFLVTESQKNNKLNTDALKVTTVWQEFE